MEALRRLGIFGGSFDPIHNAHIALAETAKEQFDLDQVWFVPSGVSYHKGHEMTAVEHRVAMVQAAIEKEPAFRFSDLDIARTGNTYTADTLVFLHQEYPETELFFLLGADSLLHMENWYHPQEIFSSATIIAARRPGRPDEEVVKKAEELKLRFEARIHLMEAVYMDISSSQIRKERVLGNDLKALVPEAVAAYIAEHDLYSECRPFSPEEIRDDLQNRLKPSRFLHTIGVAETAKKLAVQYGIDPDEAYLASLLHDCAKYMSDEEQLRNAKMADIELSVYEMQCPALIHAKLGVYYAKTRYHIHDEEILNAIRFHTTGRPGMSALEKILYVADYIEPGRATAPRLDLFRSLAFCDLDKTVCLIAEDTLHYLEETGSVIDEASRDTYEYYKSIYGKENPHD